MTNRIEIKITYRNRMNTPLHRMEKKLIKKMEEINYELKSNEFSFRTNITELIFEGDI